MSLDLRHDRPLTAPLISLGGAAGRVGEIARWMGTDRTTLVRAALSAAGVELTGPGTGRLVHEGMDADVLLEPDDVIRLTARATCSGAARVLLERSGEASGNVRFCRTGSSVLRLLAETRVDGVAHLPASLRRIGDSFAQLLDGAQVGEPEPSGDERERLRAAVAEAGWSEEEVVDTPEGHELHVPQGGARTMVQAIAEHGTVLVRRTLLPDLPEGTAGEAAAHQALADNERIRGCRLAVAHGALVVEARLCADQLDGEWLAFTVRAVAAAAQHVGPVLTLLAREPAVAAEYAGLFLSAPDAS